jgi:DNA-binding PadR family transcriptional regulator
MLALIGEGGAGASELAQMVRQGSPLFLSAARSQVYAEAARLEERGFVTSRVEPGRTKPRTVYSLTVAGREALRAWLAEPAPVPKVQNEASLRLLAGDLLDDAAIVASFAAMRPELDRMEELLAEMEEQAPRVPHRERYLKLMHDHARRTIDLHRRWIDEIEDELA